MWKQTDLHQEFNFPQVSIPTSVEKWLFLQICFHRCYQDFSLGARLLKLSSHDKPRQRQVSFQQWESFGRNCQLIVSLFLPELYLDRRTPLLILLSEHRMSINASFFERKCYQLQSHSAPCWPNDPKLPKSRDLRIQMEFYYSTDQILKTHIQNLISVSEMDTI